ncbi:MAG: DNA-3-methyladenine glycosylase I [Clostridiales bacterium]|nr:DNA-3-methyladenine glycosylase I [Clostridiales bacterium]
MRSIEHRCSYVNLNNPRYIHYHDEEWGVPEHSDQKLYEFLLLEVFQAGLSWECILNKRENFRAAFDGFDISKVCAYNEAKCAELISNPGIIRNKRKIAAAVNNSIIFKEIQQEFGSFDAYIWGFTNGETIVEDYHIRTTSPLSDAVSKDLKKRGMKFLGSTIIYSYLQAIGVLNAHGKECDLYPGKSEAAP